MPRRHRRAVLTLAALSLPLTPARAADLTWSTPTTGRWLDPTLWSTGAVPTPADTATLALTGPYTATLDASTSTGPLTLNNPDATLLFDSPPSANLTFTTGSIDIPAGTLAIHTHAGTATIQGPSSASPINLTNAGRIDYTADSAASNPTANFVNLFAISNSGTIEVHDAPTTPGLYAAVGLQFTTNASTGSFTNTGTIRAGTYSYVTVNAGTFNQNAGSIDGPLNFNGTNFNFNAGTANTVFFKGIRNLNIAPNAGAGTFVFGIGGASINADIAANQTIYIASGENAFLKGPTLTNAGHLALGGTPFSAGFVGQISTLYLPNSTDTLTNTGTLDLNAATSGPSSIVANVVNNGTVHINTPNAVYVNSSTLPYLNGSWTNSGSISVSAGAYAGLTSASTFTQNAGSLTIAAEPLSLTNSHFYYNGGTVTGNVSLTNSTLHLAPTLTSAGGTFIMSTTSSALVPFVGDIPAGVTVAPTASIPTPTAINLAPFTNAGTLTTFVTNIGYISYRIPPSGALTNTGTIAGTLNGVDRGASLRISGTLTNTGAIKAYSMTAGTFNQNAGTLDVDSTCTALNGTFNYNGGTISGKPVLLYNSTLNIAPGTNPASFTFQAFACSLHGSPAPGSSLSLDSLNSVATGTVSLTADPFTNAGTLSLTATTFSVNSTLTLPTGALTNTGTLSITKGQGGTRTINANIANSGTLTVGPATTLTYTGSLTTSTPLDLQGTLLLKPTSTLTFTHPNPADTVRTLLSTSHITSTATDATHRLAYAPTSPGILLQLSLTGDANLDGKLDADDYALLDRAFATQLPNPHWSEGDFNYDALIDQQDYLLLDTAYLSTHPSAAPTLLPQRESQFGSGYVSQLLTAIPEPSTQLACVFAELFLLPRKRRR